MLTLPPLSLYIHIPWCVQKCPYCDFNSHGKQGELPQQEYVDALLGDLDATCTMFKAGNCTASLSVAAPPPCSMLPR